MTKTANGDETFVQIMVVLKNLRSSKDIPELPRNKMKDGIEFLLLKN